MPPSVDPGSACARPAVPRGVVGIVTPVELAVHDGRRADRARRSAAGNTVVWTPAPTTSVAGVALAEASSRPTCRPASSTSSPGRARSSATRSRATPARTASASSARPQTGPPRRRGGRRQGAVLELGGNGPVVVLEDADLDLAGRGGRRRPASSAPARAAPPASGCSCTATCARSSSPGSRRLVAGAVVLGDPFADGDDARPAEQRGGRRRRWTSTSPTRSSAAPGSSPAARAPAGLPTEPLLARRRSSTACPPTCARRAEETFGPVAPIVEIESLEQAIELANASPYGLLAAVFTRDLARGLRFADAVRTGWVNVNESSNYWESHLPFGGRAGTRERHRPRRRRRARWRRSPSCRPSVLLA